MEKSELGEEEARVKHLFKPFLSHSELSGRGEPQAIQMPSFGFWGHEQVHPGLTGFEPQLLKAVRS